VTDSAARADVIRGIWKENPVLVQVLGLCPTLAVTNTVANGLVMGLAVLFVLTCSSLMVSSLRKFIPREVRLSTYILIIATFVTVADMTMEALLPDIHKALGAFVPLIVVNCIILGRQEAFAGRNPIGRSVLDALGNSAGFMIVMMMMSSVRELLGAGTLAGLRVMPASFEPWVVFVLPPGGFITLGLWLIGIAAFKQWRAGQLALRGAPVTAAGRKAA
jgi:electron transport complex protein RnfE